MVSKLFYAVDQVRQRDSSHGAPTKVCASGDSGALFCLAAAAALNPLMVNNNFLRHAHGKRYLSTIPWAANERDARFQNCFRFYVNADRQRVSC